LGLAAQTCGAIAGSPTTLGSPENFEMSAQRKHAEAAQTAAVEVIVHDAQEIAAISADYRQSTGQRKSNLLALVNERMDDLLETMLGAFTEPARVEQMENAVSVHHPLTETRLRKLDPSVVPLVVVRELLSVHLTPVRRKDLSNWSDFAERYQAFA
jgi:hypothetical protein